MKESLESVEARIAEWADRTGADRQTWPLLLSEHGSKRRVMEAYWRDMLTPETERFIEESLPWADIVGGKPV